MSDPFALARSDRPGQLRLMPIIGDSMEPTLAPGDWVLVAPTDEWRGDSGLYILEDAFGEPIVVRCSSDLMGKIDACYDNPRYHRWSMTIAEFQTRVLGCVAATIDVINHRALGMRSPPT